MGQLLASGGQSIGVSFFFFISIQIFIYLTYGYPVSPTLFVKKTIFSPINYIENFVKSQRGLFLYFLFTSVLPKNTQD